MESGSITLAESWETVSAKLALAEAVAPEPGAVALCDAEPAVPIEELIHHHCLTCLECGRKFKTLKRHLRQEHILAPEGYRAKWGLPDDYPMNAPAWAEELSAKGSKRGRKLSPERRAVAHRGKKQPPGVVAKRKATLAAKRIAKLAPAA